MEMLAAYVMEAVASALASIGTMWVNVPSPNLRAGDEAADEAAVKAAVEAAESAAVGEPAGMSELRTILSYAQWIGYVLAAIALVGLGVRIAWKTRRGEGSGLAERASLIMGGTVLVGAATGLTSGFLADRPEGASSAIVFLQSALWQPALILVALSVIGGAVTMIWQQRADPGKQTLKGILEFILLSGAGVAAVQILLNMGDEFAPWIIDAALGGDCGGVSVRDPGGGSCFSENLLAWSTVTSKLSGPATPVVLIILLGLILLICSLIQICMMVIRGGMLIVLAGMLPIAAAGFGFEWGRGWLRRFLGWLGAAIAYKPAAAIIYAAGFKLAGTNPWGDDGIWQIVYGVAILLVALFALPALMKLFAPPTSAAAGGGGGGGTAALVAAGAGLAASFGGRGGGSPSGSDQNSATPQGNTAPAT
ncbi:MAG: hypothetical protein LBS56_10755, partial [Propionibacteriaceae bacterium]|nr:hypothetical protein [Propionibacteriaceae bacterium]